MISNKCEVKIYLRGNLDGNSADRVVAKLV